MCLIIASPKAKLISAPTLESAARTNSHGGGVAWYHAASKKIRWKKGLKVEQVIDVLNGEAKGIPHIVHFRIATVGGICPELTHPFTIDERASIELEGEADSVLFHNGGVGNWKELLFHATVAKNVKLPKHPWSDTRAVAYACGVWGPHILSIIGDGSRFMVFDAKAPPTERMLTWGGWYNKDDLMFSNQGGMYAGTTSYTTPVTPPNIRNVTPDVSAGTRRIMPPQGADTDLGDPRMARPDITDYRSNRRYKPASNFKVWESLAATGLSLKADNEEALRAVTV